MPPEVRLVPKSAVIEYLANLIGFSHRSAELVHDYLCDFGFDPEPKRGETNRFPAEFLLELGAILQIAHWEFCGVRRFLQVDLPIAGEAIHDLWRRYNESPLQFFKTPSGTILTHRVADAWLQHCATAAPAEIGVDVALTGNADDAAMEAIAAFLWRHRHLANRNEEND